MNFSPAGSSVPPCDGARGDQPLIKREIMARHVLLGNVNANPKRNPKSEENVSGRNSNVPPLVPQSNKSTASASSSEHRTRFLKAESDEPVEATKSRTGASTSVAPDNIASRGDDAQRDHRRPAGVEEKENNAESHERNVRSDEDATVAIGSAAIKAYDEGRATTQANRGGGPSPVSSVEISGGCQLKKLRTAIATEGDNGNRHDRPHANSNVYANIPLMWRQQYQKGVADVDARKHKIVERSDVEKSHKRLRRGNCEGRGAKFNGSIIDGTVAMPQKVHPNQNGTNRPHALSASAKCAEICENKKKLATCHLPANADVSTPKQINKFFGTNGGDYSTLNDPVPVFPNHPWNPQMPVFQRYPWAPSIPPMTMEASLRPVAPFAMSLHQQELANFSTPAAPLTMPTQQSTANFPSISKECCSHNLNPAPLPRNPIDDEWENSTPLEKEIAWLLEESDVILPLSRSSAVSQNMQYPILLDFAWKYGSLQLREKILETFPTKISALIKKLNDGSTTRNNDVVAEKLGPQLALIDGYDLLWSRRGSETSGDNENICRLRKEASHALRLGYRRSELIERELNIVQGLRWRDAVEEMGDPGADEYWAPKPKQSRHRRKRNEALLKAALGKDCDSTSRSQSATELETIASKVPSELTPLEDEVAWLVEESLILLPDDMVDNSNSSSKQTTSIMSAGLVTKSAEIKWDYVVQYASEPLKEEFKRIGGIKRRPLQRIIRHYKSEVRCAFQKRRDDIASLLLLRGYRRKETKHALPSDEILVQTGLDKVWAVRLMRRRQNEASEEMVSSKDLRSACNARIGDKARCAKSAGKARSTKKVGRPRKKKRASHVSTAHSMNSQTAEAAAGPAVAPKGHVGASSEKPQHPEPAARLPVALDAHANTYSKASECPEPIARPHVAQDAHANTSSKESKSTEPVARLPVAQDAHANTSSKESKSTEPVARLPVAQDAHANTHLKESKHPEPVARPPVARDGHANTSSKESKPTEPVARLPVAQDAHANTYSKSTECPEPIARPHVAQDAHANTSLKESKPTEPVARLPVVQEVHANTSSKESKSTVPVARLPVAQDPHANAHLKESKCPDPIARPPVAQDAHANTSPKESKPTDPVARLPVVQEVHANTPSKELKLSEPLARIPVAQEAHANTPLKESKHPDASARLAATRKAQSSILTVAEEEIAWLREECELETGKRGYDWDYVERNSSLPLLIELAERRCAPSGFPSAPGASRLRAMVRLHVPGVAEAFESKRADVRRAIISGFRRNRGDRRLPDVPPLARKNGASVVDLEYARDGFGGRDGVENEIICVDDSSDDEANGEDRNVDSSRENDDGDGGSVASSGEREGSNHVAPSCRDMPSKRLLSSGGGAKDDKKSTEASTGPGSSDGGSVGDGESVASSGEREGSNHVAPSSRDMPSKRLLSSDGGAKDDKKSTEASTGPGSSDGGRVGDGEVGGEVKDDELDASESASMSDEEDEVSDEEDEVSDEEDEVSDEEDEMSDDSDDEEYEVSSEDDSEEDGD